MCNNLSVVNHCGGCVAYVVNVGSEGRSECREPARNRQGRLACIGALCRTSILTVSPKLVTCTHS